MKNVLLRFFLVINRDFRVSRRILKRETGLAIICYGNKASDSFVKCNKTFRFKKKKFDKHLELLKLA